jgi:hypothetical protein
MKRIHKVALLVIVVIVVVVGLLQLISAKENSSLPPKSNHLIGLIEASKMTHAYRAQAGPDAIKGGLFWKEYVQKLLDQPDCAAMRYYYAIGDAGKPTIVLVGVDSNGSDITDGIILELSPWCPPFCDNTNSLTSDVEVAIGN